jgi:hypothetical protein
MDLLEIRRQDAAPIFSIRRELMSWTMPGETLRSNK